MLLAFVKISQSETSRQRLPDKMAKVTNVRLLLINNLRKWILNRLLFLLLLLLKNRWKSLHRAKKKYKINFLKLGFFSLEWHHLIFLKIDENDLVCISILSSLFKHFAFSITFCFESDCILKTLFWSSRLHGYRVRSSKAPDFGVCLMSQTTAMLITHQKTSSVADIVITFVILSM